MGESAGRDVERALLLNSTFMPLRIVSWKKAIILMALRKAEAIEVYDREIHTVSLSIPLPSVIRLFKFVRIGDQEVRFTRHNIYLRDQGRCQYCGRRFNLRDLTYDHVIPRARGGTATWENIVTCCRSCNLRKGGRTPKEAEMTLIRRPVKPKWLPILDVAMEIHRAPKSWRNYLPEGRLFPLFFDRSAE
ncbi:MAG: HNH endonuclease [Deltaproteobacteria bacterium]|nr:HNH endonuclease [Deltaproteobacteria bacterium]MBW2122314.1 HNH endonuclease [Deltaproteobacteria bacterium]